MPLTLHQPKNPILFSLKNDPHNSLFTLCNHSATNNAVRHRIPVPLHGLHGCSSASASSGARCLDGSCSNVSHHRLRRQSIGECIPISLAPFFQIHKFFHSLTIHGPLARPQKKKAPLTDPQLRLVKPKPSAAKPSPLALPGRPLGHASTAFSRRVPVQIRRGQIHSVVEVG